MMDMEQLEKERKKALIKFIILIILLVLTGGYFIYRMVVMNSLISTVEIVVLIVLFVILPFFGANLPKEFEAKFKKNMMNEILKKIVSNDGEIKWQNNRYYASTSRTELEKWNDEFKEEITYANVDKKLENRILELSKNIESLNEEEKQELEQLRKKESEIYKKHNDMCHRMFSSKLNELENRVNKQEKPKEKDLLHIEFYKKQIKKCEKEKEIDELKEKRNNILTQEELNKLDEYSDLFEEESLSDNEKNVLIEKEPEKFQDYKRLLDKWNNALTKEEQEKIDKFYENIIRESQDFQENLIDFNVLYNLFNRYCEYDEMFYGKYKNIDFALMEYDQTDGVGKNKITFLKGNVIQIPCDINYKNKLVIMEKKIFITNMWEKEITKGLKELKLGIQLPNNKKIFTDNFQGADDILNQEFIDFINSLDAKYSYAFEEGNLYIIWNTKRDCFKLGSLFAKVDDRKQYEKFKTDILECLDIVELVGKINWNKK